MLFPAERRRVGGRVGRSKVQAGQVVEVADGPAGAEEKPRPGGGVGVAGPVGPGVVDAMPTGVLMFRGSDPLRVPRLHAIQ